MPSIRQANENDLEAILSVVQAAFKEDTGGEGSVTQLVKDALKDPSAEPVLSLLALKDQQPVGHTLFTKAHLDTHPDVSVSLLAPLAVVPDYQRQGIGSRLVQEGLALLNQASVKLVFVLGHPQYYPRHGFQPASPLGFSPPYPTPEKEPDAWMVRELCPGAISKNAPARFNCASSIDRPAYWEEDVTSG